MPILASVVEEIPQEDMPELYGKPMPIQCHHATLYWICKALGRNPTMDELLDASSIIKNLALKAGAQVNRPSMFSKLTLPPGTVLFFDGTNTHSCITTSSSDLGGYNQTNWFRTEGKASQYSQHKLSDIRWLDGSHVQGNSEYKNQGNWSCKLWRILEAKAREHLQG